MLVYNYTTTDGELCHSGFESNYLAHVGVKGMKWGHRKARPQPTGMRRYRNSYKNQVSSAKTAYKQQKQAYKKTAEYKAERKAKAKKAAKVGGAVAAAALATYGAYKLNKYVKNKNTQIAIDRGWKEISKKVEDSNRMHAALAKKGMTVTKSEINFDNIIRSHVDRANSDSFARAAKNVIDNRRQRNWRSWN